MKLLWTLEDYYKNLNDCLDLNPSKIWISTFNLYAGITKDNKDVREEYNKRNLTGNFLERIDTNKIECNILCGIPREMHCNNEHCEYCERKHLEMIKRYIHTMERFPNPTWKFVNELHFKCVVFEYPGKQPWAFTGGRNLTDSGWDDVTIDLDPHKSFLLLDKVKRLWEEKPAEKLWSEK